MKVFVRTYGSKLICQGRVIRCVILSNVLLEPAGGD